MRCGFSLIKYGAVFAMTRGTLTWLLRRSLAGFAAGMAGWWVIPAASRAAGPGVSQAAHLLMSSAIGGVFLGTVEGMMEESSIKTFWGGLAGFVGGLLGASAAMLVLQSTWAHAGMAAVVVTWGLAGAFVGVVSAWLERRMMRIVAGAAFGFLGGALGGWLGYEMYAGVSDIARTDSWVLKRVVEGATGAILGAVLWFMIGLGERLFVFKRRVVENISYKECDACHYNNVLKAWYCASCGAVLQVSAPPSKLELPKRQAVARFISACQYLGQLSITTSLVVAVLAAGFLGSINVFLGLFGLLATALIGYIGSILFNAAAEILSPLLASPPDAK